MIQANNTSMNWRKVLISPVGMAAMAGGLCPLFLFLYGIREPALYVLFAVLGAAVGLQTQRRLKKNYRYLFENVEQNKLDANRRFFNLLKDGQLPTSKVEQTEFLAFLDSVQQAYDQAMNKLPQFALVVGVTVVAALTTRKWWLLLVPALVTAYTLYMLARARARAQKIQDIRTRIAGSK